LKTLNLPLDKIPQINDINTILQKETGWTVLNVPAIIPANKFFELLANKQFPVASFIRIPEEFDYLEEPDLFHEIFGHCPLLTNPLYANFMEWYGKLALDMPPKDRNLLFRLFWFTIEFGLIKQKDSYKAYGGGILSSPKETVHATEGKEVFRSPLDVLTALRTPFRIDIMQPLYYYIDKFEDLFELTKLNINEIMTHSRELGSLDPIFPKKEKHKGGELHGY
jgi:phenylalanine-4-hydroxylase